MKKFASTKFTEYLVSATGTIFSRNKNSGKVKAITAKGTPYCKVHIGGDVLYVHRIVASAFCENPEGYIEVNHKDRDKTNNDSDNLEWCTRQHNQAHALSKTFHSEV